MCLGLFLGDSIGEIFVPLFVSASVLGLAGSASWESYWWDLCTIAWVCFFGGNLLVVFLYSGGRVWFFATLLLGSLYCVTESPGHSGGISTGAVESASWELCW